MNAPASSFQLSMASFRFDTVGSLLGSGSSASANSAGPMSFEFMLSEFTSTYQTDKSAPGQFAAGRNMSLNDPEAAFAMMTDINCREVCWKAEFAELSDMDGSVSALSKAADALKKLSADEDSGSILSQLQAFVAQYNLFSERFVPETGAGGLLGKTQAAGVTVHELEASVRNLLNGSRGGIQGLEDLGVSVESKSRTLTLDQDVFLARLSAGKENVIQALHEFADNFGGAAQAVAGDGKFIDRQLENLDRVLDYLRDNSTALREEFGTGAPPKVEGRMAKAVQTYERILAA